jgi:hypothetical protein
LNGCKAEFGFAEYPLTGCNMSGIPAD